jgi:hypothetical protein
MGTPLDQDSLARVSSYKAGEVINGRAVPLRGAV